MRILRWHKSPVRAVAYSPDGAFLAAGGNDHRIRLWNLPCDDRHRMLAGHEAWVRGLAFSADGKTIASAGWDDLVKVWGVEENLELGRRQKSGRGLVAGVFSFGRHAGDRSGRREDLFRADGRKEDSLPSAASSAGQRDDLRAGRAVAGDSQP